MRKAEGQCRRAALVFTRDTYGFLHRNTFFREEPNRLEQSTREQSTREQSTREQAQLNSNPLDLCAKSAFWGRLEGVKRVISVFSSFHRRNITLSSTPICPKIQSNSPGSTGLFEKQLPTCAGSTRCFDINQNMSRLTPVAQYTKIEMNRNLGQAQPDKFRGKLFI